VKIIVRDGTISLKATVDSQREKDTIGSEAGGIAGKDNVENQLEVKAGKKFKPKNRKIDNYEKFRVMPC
jgi:osmotically-inducible protein OsmY